jgi:hypothetical protein
VSAAKGAAPEKKPLINFLGFYIYVHLFFNDRGKLLFRKREIIIDMAGDDGFNFSLPLEAGVRYLLKSFSHEKLQKVRVILLIQSRQERDRRLKT